MDSLSSSFFTKFHPHKLILSPPSPTKNPLFYISAVNVEDRLTINDPKPTPSSPLSQNPTNRTPITSSSVATKAKNVGKDPKKSTITRRRSITTTDLPSVPTSIFNAFDSIINNFIDPAIRPSVDPKHVLAKNFAPVDELPPTKCTVIQGAIPPSINGAYIRNGPNPQHLPHGPYHLFDGDGMLHSLLISNGTATFCSRYVKTYKYTVEREHGSSIFPNVFSGFNGLTASVARGAVTAARVLSGQYNPVNGIGLANTSLAFFGDKLFALGESDLPYEIKLTPDGEIVTLGRHDFDGKLFMSMTAHPKVDPSTGEAFAFRYGPIPPFLTFFRFNSSGSKQPDVPIFSMTRPAFLHDFAITQKFAIFTEIQIGMNPMEMIVGNGSPVGADPSVVSRIGVIPRYAKDESDMKWFDVPGFNIIHAVNAWDEGEDEIVLIAPNILSVEHTLERMELIHALMEKVRINLRTGMVSRHPVSARNLDFGVINQNFTGKKNRFVYAGIGDPMPKISGVVKLDVGDEHEQNDCTVGCRMFGSGCYGGEPFYVAKEPENLDADEDDGYVVTYVHDENLGESKFLVMDAKSPTLDVVAAVTLPGRVPYGFHGIFVRESELKKLM
nr:carotenoid cleavage dioxygenase 4 [Chelidonium majus]